MENNENLNPLRKYCDYLRNQDECACPAKIENLKEKAPVIYEMGYRRVGGDVCIFVIDHSFAQCPFRRINGEEVIQ